MKHALIARLKGLIRPISNQRFRIERAKYREETILSDQDGNDFLAASLARGLPFAAGKIGATELGGICRYEKCKDARGICTNWGQRNTTRLHRNAGVYPSDPEIFSRFAALYNEALGSLDVLAVWFNLGEHAIRRRYAPNAKLTYLAGLEPFYHPHPWSRHLSGKRVLVLTPFSETIKTQGRRLPEVWRARPEVLGGDVEVDTLRVPLSAGLTAPLYPDWFVALDAMTQEMASRKFDVAIAGAGAWSIPLVARAKQMGKWAIHLGGGAQILFGVKGRRWDNNPLVVEVANDAWVRPSDDERPKSFEGVEQGCYW